MAVDSTIITRLISTLNQTKLQQDNPALYQVIHQLIKATAQNVDGLSADISSSSGGSSTGGIDQLTGDVTAGPGSGSQAATIPNDTVTYAKMQNVSAASKILGRGSAAGAGDVQEITLGTNLSMSGTTLNATDTDTGITQLTGDVTAGPGSGSQAATIPNNTVTYAKMQDVSAASRLLGRGSASAGDPQEITLDASLSISGTTLAVVSGGSGINQLTGDVTAGPGTGSVAATLSNTGVTAATYGDSTNVGQFTVDAKGRITAAGNVAITATGGGTDEFGWFMGS